MTSKFKTLCALTALGLGLSVMATAEAKPAKPKLEPGTVTLTLDTTKPGVKLSRHVFGQFAEHLGTGIYGGVWVGSDSKIPNTRGIRNDVVTALKALKIPNVRWPGGCFADDYHWRKGIGPQSARPATLNYLWGKVIEPNSFGTHEFMDFIDQIGSEAYMSGNVGSGSPQEMSDWLEYMTADQPTALAKERQANGRDKPYKVPIFGVGNETWGCGGSMTAEHYADQYRNFATYARNYDPAQTGESGMKRIASGANADDFHWTEVMMKQFKDVIFSWSMDGLSLHYYSGYNQWPPHYSSTNFDEDAYAHVIKSAYKMNDLIVKHSAIMDKYDPDKKVILAVDEWGAWYKPDDGTNPGFLQQQNSQRDAVLAAVHFHIFSRHADRVRMANVAQMVNVLQAMVLTKGDKIVLTPTYYAFKMYVPFQDATLLPVKYEPGEYKLGDVIVPKLDIAAARATDGKVWLALVNIDPTQAVEIDAATLGLEAKSAKGETLSAPKIDSFNSFEAPDLVKPKAISAKLKNGHLLLKLAPESVTVVQIN
jgi:alpha-L-arabinofuranosidase